MKLIVHSVSAKDSGEYSCEVTSGPISKARLEIKGAPSTILIYGYFYNCRFQSLILSVLFRACEQVHPWAQRYHRSWKKRHQFWMWDGPDSFQSHLAERSEGDQDRNKVSDDAEGTNPHPHSEGFGGGWWWCVLLQYRHCQEHCQADRSR